MKSIAPGLRERQLFGDRDYVCTDCVTIVLDPEKGCPACTIRRENKERKKQEFFTEMEATRDRERLEDQQLRAEAIATRLEHVFHLTKGA